MTDNILTFSVDRIEILEQISNSQFARARVWAFASGENKHEMVVSEEALIRAESTIYDKPLVWLYNKTIDDATGHSNLEVPAGFVPKHSANISYERVDDGRLFFVVDVLIWKHYCGRLLEIFKKADGKKSVSVEIVLVETKELENGKTEIVDFVYRAITVIGDMYSPAIPLANAQIIQFSQDKIEVEKMLEFSVREDELGKSPAIEIDNSKDSAIKSGSWSNPGAAFLNKLLKAKNHTSLVKEAYAKIDGDPSGNLSINDVGYPHHEIKDGKLVLSVPGVNAAYKRARQQGESGSIMSHIQEHRKTLELDKEVDHVSFNKEEFAKSFSMTANELWSLLDNACREEKYKEEGSNYQYSRYSMWDHDDNYIYAFDRKEDKTVAIPYSISNGKAILDFKNIKPAKQKWVISDEADNMLNFVKGILSDDFLRLESEYQEKIFALENKKNELVAKFSALEAEVNTLKAEKEEVIMKVSALENEKAEFVEKITTLENEKVEFTEKINTLEAENSELKTFKSNVEEQERKAKIDFAINSVADDLTQEQIDEWRNKADEYENIEAFTNAIKAFAYSVSKGKKEDNEFVIASMVKNNQNNNTKKGLWD